MKVPREQLEDQLRLIINEYAVDKQLHDEIVNNMENKNIPPGETRAILTQSSLYPLETMDIGLIYTLTKKLYRATGRGVLNPENYFYPNEMEEGDKWKRLKTKEVIGDIVLPNFVQVTEDQWIGTIDSQKLVHLYNNGRVLYRPEHQRGLKLVKTKDSILHRIDYNIDAINNIKEMLLGENNKPKFIPNTITFNVLKNGNDVVKFDPENHTLIIGAGSEINVNDGFHRNYGTIKAVATDPSFNQVWELRVVNWDGAKAERFIRQEDYKTPLRKERRESLDQTKLENIIVNNLNEASQNEMQFKVAIDTNAIGYNRAYVMFSTMAEAIRDNFEIKSQRDVRKITDYLVEFFNEFIGMHIDDFNNIPRSQGKSYITMPNMFIGYITIAGELYKTNNWQDLLEDIVASVDFTKQNVFWEQINISKSTLTRRERQKLTNYFKNKIEEAKKNVR